MTGGGTGRLDRYDPASDRWDTLAPIPASDTGQQVGGGLAMAAVGERLVAFGGEWFARPGGGVFSETWIYDIARDAWTRGPDMATPRHGLAACAVGGTVLAIAGGEVVSGGKASARGRGPQPPALKRAARVRAAAATSAQVTAKPSSSPN